MDNFDHRVARSFDNAWNSRDVSPRLLTANRLGWLITGLGMTAAIAMATLLPR